MTVDALVCGRVALDLYPVEIERPLEDVERFRQYAGGFATNVATGLARLGHRVAVFSGVGDDGPGRHVRGFLEQEGIDTGWLGTHPTLRTALAFCEIWPPDDFPLLFYREPTCPDWEVTLGDVGLDPAAAAAVPLLYLSGTALARAGSGESAVALAGARTTPGTHTVLDLDWRPTLWPSPEAYAEQVARVLPAATVVLGGDSEWAAAGLDPAADLHCVRVAKHGPEGCTVHAPDGEAREVAGLPVAAVNGLGAGDAFAAGWGHALLGGDDDPGRVANAMGAIVATRHSCSRAMPTLGELDGFLATGDVPEPVLP